MDVTLGKHNCLKSLYVSSGWTIRGACSDWQGNHAQVCLFPPQRLLPFCERVLNSTAFTVNGQRKTRKRLICLWKLMNCLSNSKSKANHTHKSFQGCFTSRHDVLVKYEIRAISVTNCWQQSLNISSQSQWQQRQSRTPHHHASFLFLLYIQCEMRLLLQYVPWKISLDKLPVTSVWSKLGWSSRGIMLGDKSFLAFKDKMPSTARNSSIYVLQQSHVLVPPQGLGFNGRCHDQAAVYAYGPVSVHRGFCPSMCVI